MPKIFWISTWKYATNCAYCYYFENEQISKSWNKFDPPIDQDGSRNWLAIFIKLGWQAGYEPMLTAYYNVLVA